MVRAIRSLKVLRSLHSWDDKSVAAYQAGRLRSVVRHAARSVPYYARLFAEAGLDAGQVQSPTDLLAVPVSKRREMQALPPTDLVAAGLDPDRLLGHLSSGSTGEPFTTRRTVFEDNLLLAFRVRVFQALGLRLRDRRLAVMWMEHETPRREVWERFGILRRLLVSCMLPADEILEEMRELDFDVLSGLPGTLGEVADLLTPEDRLAMRPRLVLTAAETSTPALRRRLAETFAAPLYDLYGTNEFNVAAWQCPETGLYHVSDPTVVLEVVDERGTPVPPGEEGEVVGTNLHAFASPFVRYRLDDVAVRGPSPCPCGAPWSTLERILGRVPQRFRLRDGRTIHPYNLQQAFMPGAPWLQGFQIIQERLDLVRLRLRPLRHRTPTAEDLERAARGVADFLGDGVEVTTEVVDELPRGGRGKSLHYVCNVS